MTDEIMKEVWREKDEIAAEFNYDIYSRNLDKKGRLLFPAVHKRDLAEKDKGTFCLIPAEERVILMPYGYYFEPIENMGL